MTRRTDRRGLLAAAGTVAVAGCLDRLSAGDPGRDLPEECPTSQDLDVEWPRELTPETVEAFVESYDEAYVREVVVGFESDSRLDAYRMSGGVDGAPTERGDGYVVETSGGGAVYTPHLHLTAAVAEAPEDAERVAHGEVDHEDLRRLLAAAVDADDGEATARVGPGEGIDGYLETFAALFDDYDRLEEPGDSATLYLRVDDADVELSAHADTFHGDYGWRARYYVDEYLLRRATDPETDPRDGELLECRSE